MNLRKGIELIEELIGKIQDQDDDLAMDLLHELEDHAGTALVRRQEEIDNREEEEEEEDELDDVETENEEVDETEK